MISPPFNVVYLYGLLFLFRWRDYYYEFRPFSMELHLSGYTHYYSYAFEIDQTLDMLSVFNQEKASISFLSFLLVK